MNLYSKGHRGDEASNVGKKSTRTTPEDDGLSRKSSLASAICLIKHRDCISP